MNIDSREFNSTLTRVFADNSLASLLNMDKCDKFYKLTIRLLEENEKYNLTAITEVDKIILKVFNDFLVFIILFLSFH